MAYPAYVQEKARQLRIEKHLSIDEIAERLALPKTTIYYWVKDLPLGRPRRANPGQTEGQPQHDAKCRLRRAAAYALGRLEFERLSRDPAFRDFVCLYIAEGTSATATRVVGRELGSHRVVLCTRWISRFARNPVRLQRPVSRGPGSRRTHQFWGGQVGVAPRIRLQRKSNSGQLTGRTWRSRHGVLTVYAGDTLCVRAFKGGSIAFRSSG